MPALTTVAKDAFAKAARKPLTWVALIAIPLIVACFGLMYYGTFMDPYERMKDLPIAVINEDAGAQVNGQEYNFGADLVNSITESDRAKWTVEDASLAENGLENSNYFLAVVIPQDFSERVYAGQTAEPEQANITFFKNVRKNYTLSTMASSIEAALRTTVNEKIGQQYTQAYLEGLQSAGTGMGEAADGASALGEGIGTAKDGSTQLASGASDLRDGAKTLESGLVTLESGSSSLESGLGTLTGGAQTLVSGTSSLASGSATLATGLSSLDAGVQALDAGAAALSDRATQLATTGNALTSGSSRIVAGIAQLSAGSDTFRETLQGKQDALAQQFGGNPANAIPALQAVYAQALHDYATNVAIATKTGQDPTAVDTSALEQAAANLSAASRAAGAYSTLDQALSGYQQIDDGIGELAGSYAELDTGITAYVNAAGQLAAGASNAQAGASTLAGATSNAKSGADTLAAGAQSAQTGAVQLASGVQSAQDGAAQLTAGAQSAAAGASKLTSGAGALQDGAGTLTDGLQTAQDGASTLATSLSNGSQTVDDALTASPADLAEYTAQPVSVNDDAYGNLDKFGYGFAPLFLSLSLWLGALLIFFILDPFPSREHLGVNRLAAVIGRWPAYLVFSALEGIVVFAGSVALGLPMTNTALFALVIATICFAFMCMLQLLNLFDTPGKAIGVLLVVLQLVCCSGTLPAELGTNFAVAAGPYLPFYYSIDALREAMSGGVAANAFADLGMLLAFAAGAVALSLLVYPRALALKRRRDAETVQAITGKPAEKL